MKIIKPYVEQMTPPIDGIEFLKTIERAGRVCYKSEDKITDTSCLPFVARLIKNGHEAMIEHAPSISMKFVCDRGVSHEIVRHRLFSFAMESTRYCDYSGEGIVFILPDWFEYCREDDFEELSGLMSEDKFNEMLYNMYEDDAIWDVDEGPKHPEVLWLWSMRKSEIEYQNLINLGWSPQQARSVLPNSLKTEIIVTGNLREWRHFFRLRTAKTAHPQMQEVANMALDMLKAQIPVVFDDIV